MGSVKRHSTERVKRDAGACHCARVCDPTVPVPPMWLAEGPGTRYALIPSSKYVSRETPLEQLISTPPGVYIF